MSTTVWPLRTVATSELVVPRSMPTASRCSWGAIDSPGSEICSYYTDWTETDGTQNSLNQYIGLTSGIANGSTVNDCTPSATCRSTDDNIFRQVREAGGTARSYVDGATAPCSVGTNKAKHIPALYYQGGDDAAHCTDEVRPLTELDPDHLPMLRGIT